MIELSRVLVYEHLCAVPPADAEDPQQALRGEGRAMLRAAAAALAAVPDLRVAVCAAAPLGPWDTLHPERFPWAAGEFAGVLLIAPEVDGIANRLAAAVVAAGGTLLGPGPELVALAADKLATAALLGGLAPPGWLLKPDGGRRPAAGRVVVKPRDGVGAMFTLVGPAEEAPAMAAALRKEGCRSELLVQPWLAGLPASIALLGRGAEPPVLLPAVRQHISETPHPANPAWSALSYRGGSAPLAEPWRSTMQRLAFAVADRLPRWKGYLGIDTVVTEAGGFVLDVNPRLTTSFLGYCELLPGRMGRLLLGRDTADDRAAIAVACNASPRDFAP